MEKDLIQHEYVRAYTNASLIVKEGFGFEDGLFTGYNEDTRSYDSSSWDYELDDQGFAKIDDSWKDPHCVINLLRKHVERYTPEMVSRICGTPQDKYLEICALLASTLEAGQSADEPVRARLDAAFRRRAEHPHAWRWCNCCSATSASPAAE